MRILVTGTAGFIGFHLARRLLDDGHDVFGLDGFTAYYDQTLKRRRHEILAAYPKFAGRELQLEDAAGVSGCVADAAADSVIHLAAQAGVRYSFESPRTYIDSNIVGTFNLLEALKPRGCGHLIVASTSSVYGESREQPFKEDQATSRPLSLYAATKIAAEALVYSHAKYQKLPTTTVRLFTVFGPWGRPDMAFFKFTRNILEGLPIDVYGFGDMRRDFTYVADVVESIRLLIGLPPGTAEGADAAPHRVVNIGYGQPTELERFIAVIEAALGRKAIRRELPMQPGDVPSTWADTSRLRQLTGFTPSTPLEQGIEAFVAWYRDYYRL